MSYDSFNLIAQTARELRTEAATYALLEAYARSGCATYPVDSELFREIWPDEQVPGFVLRPYPHMNTHTVTYLPRLLTLEKARLIAAAPDLLEALRAVLKVTENGTCINFKDERDPVIENALAAIAKATTTKE